MRSFRINNLRKTIYQRLKSSHILPPPPLAICNIHHFPHFSTDRMLAYPKRLGYIKAMENSMQTPIELGPRVIFTPRDAHMNLLSTREAWGITFPGFEDFTFRLYKMDGLWAIAELQSGLPIVRGMDSRYAARDKAVILLERMGMAKTRSAVIAAVSRIKDHGIVEINAHGDLTNPTD